MATKVGAEVAVQVPTEMVAEVTVDAADVEAATAMVCGRDRGGGCGRDRGRRGGHGRPPGDGREVGHEGSAQYRVRPPEQRTGE